MNSDTIREFNEALRSTLSEQGPVFGDRLLQVETSGQQPRDTGYEVVKKTLEALDGMAQ